MSTAEQLKNEGNALYASSNFVEAHKKYTAAMAEKPDKEMLAILYQNRALNSWRMKKYLDSMNDGQEATRLDPKSAKGWLRIAVAAEELGYWDVAKNACGTGISVLPSAKLSSSMRETMTAQFEATIQRLNSSQKEYNGKVSGGEYTRESWATLDHLPATRAAKLLQRSELKRNIIPSSGFAIMQAHADFDRGMNLLGMTTAGPQIGSQTAFQFANGVVTAISNAVLCDKRSFMLSAGNFFNAIELQMTAERQQFKAWGFVGLEQLKKEVLDRLRRSSWTQVRPAVATTMRCWVLTGFFDMNLGKQLSAIQHLQRTVDFLEWGARQFPASERGTVFESSFIRGVRRLHLEAVLSMYMTDGCAKSGHSLEDIQKLAQELKTETESSIAPANLKETNPGAYIAFFVYPAAEALAALAWVHRQKSQRASSKQELSRQCSAGSRLYIKAAEAYPEDEEERPLLLFAATELLWWSKTPLRLTLPLCRRIADALPKIEPIWGGPMAKLRPTADRVNKCEKAVAFLRDCEKRIEQGKLSLDQAEVPGFVRGN
ncbi:hypothetical protein MKEN_01269800 [Mycena kentingensis (nom. inval.)]|nr:hypothetical protein MKEN_01269800 [Mycena kentingensis (nom. inval.)]